MECLVLNYGQTSGFRNLIECFPNGLRLHFCTVNEIDTVQITFDSNLNRPVGQRPGIKGPIPQCVKDYNIYYYNYKEHCWIKICEVTENYP